MNHVNYTSTTLANRFLGTRQLSTIHRFFELEIIVYISFCTYSMIHASSISYIPSVGRISSARIEKV